MSNALCCCEYVDIDGHRNHLLACCCNCQQLDLCFDRLFTCKKLPNNLIRQLMATVGDRMRFPWLGGARRVSSDCLIPVLALPLFLFCSAQSPLCTAACFLFLPVFLILSRNLFTKFKPRTQFFLSWYSVSNGMSALIFGLLGKQLMFIRNDELAVYFILTVLTVWTGYKVKSKSRLSYVTVDYASECDLRCSNCSVSPPPRTYHCPSCNVCVQMKDLHCFWLNCCIGQSNHIWFFAFLTANFWQNLLFSNLVMTTVCHPFPVIGSILLPDDCSDIYEDLLYSFLFVTAVYCLVVSIFCLLALFREMWIITLGITGQELRSRGKASNLWGVLISRPYSVGPLRNWKGFFLGQKMYEIRKI